MLGKRGIKPEELPPVEDIKVFRKKFLFVCQKKQLTLSAEKDL
jgi:hypothetical protein